jgi:hypothetical protein
MALLRVSRFLELCDPAIYLTVERRSVLMSC